MNGGINVKLKAFAAALTCAALTFSACLASPLTLTCEYNPQKKELRVSGASDSDVFAVITEQNKALSSLYETPPFEADQIDAKKDEYSKIFYMTDAETGKKYDIFVSNRNGEKRYSSILIYDYSEAEKIYSEVLKKANSFDEFCSLFEDNAVRLGIDTEDANYIAYRDKLLKYLFACKSETFIKFKDDYEISLCFASLNDGDTNAVLEHNSRLLGIDYKLDFADNKKLSASIRETVVKKISEHNFEDICKNKSPFLNFFTQICCESSVNESESWVELKKIITEDYPDLFTAPLKSEEYIKIKVKDNVFKQLINLPCSTFAEINASLGKAIKNISENERKSSFSSGSGGGSSRGGGYAGGSFEKKEDTNKPVSFSDMGSTHWGYKAVAELYSRGIVSGYEDGSIKPDNKVTRAEFVKITVESLTDIEGKAENADFEDVTDADWFLPFVSKALAQRLIMGDNGKFMPNENITRQDACVILYRALKNKGFLLSKTNSFIDFDMISDYAQTPVSALYSAEIVSGIGEGLFEPLRNLNRAEAFQLIYNTLMKTER